MNRFLLIVIALLFSLVCVGYFTSINTTLSNHANQFLTVAQYLGLIMLLGNGTFYGSGLFKIAMVFVVLIAIGAVLKMLHIAGADMLLLFPFPILFCVYLVHFIQKKPKLRLDWLKLLMLATFLAMTPLSLLHLISYDDRVDLQLLNYLLFSLTFLDFLYTTRKQNRI